MELIPVPLVTDVLSHLLFIFVRLWLNVQQKCPFTPKRVNTCVKEVRLRSLSCKIYNQNVHGLDIIAQRRGRWSGEAARIRQSHCSFLQNYVIWSVLYIHTYTQDCQSFAGPPSAHIKELYVIADEQFQAVSKTCQEVTNIL